MSTEDLENRVLSLEQEVNHIKSYYQRTLSYQYSDPEAALWMARKATEAICRQIFVREISPNLGTITLEELLVQLTKRRLIPKGIEVPIRTIQQYGNFGTHDQGHDNIAITREFAEPCLKSLSTVVDWYFNEYIGEAMGLGTLPTAPTPEEAKINAKSVPRPWWRTPHICWLSLPVPGTAHLIIGQWPKTILLLALWLLTMAFTVSRQPSGGSFFFILYVIAIVDSYSSAKAILNGIKVGRFQWFPRTIKR